MATAMDSLDEPGVMIVKRVSVPIGLEELMEGLTKEVLLKKPKDIYVFASDYFAKLLVLREKGNYKARPVRAVQSITKQVNARASPKLQPVGVKPQPVRPTRQLSRQLSIREQSPTKKSPNATKVREPSTDRNRRRIEARAERHVSMIKESDSSSEKDSKISPRMNLHKKRIRSLSSSRKESASISSSQNSPRERSQQSTKNIAGGINDKASVKSNKKEKVQNSIPRKVDSTVNEIPLAEPDISRATNKSGSDIKDNGIERINVDVPKTEESVITTDNRDKHGQSSSGNTNQNTNGDKKEIFYVQEIEEQVKSTENRERKEGSSGKLEHDGVEENENKSKNEFTTKQAENEFKMEEKIIKNHLQEPEESVVVASVKNNDTSQQKLLDENERSKREHNNAEGKFKQENENLEISEKKSEISSDKSENEAEETSEYKSKDNKDINKTEEHKTVENFKLKHKPIDKSEIVRSETGESLTLNECVQKQNKYELETKGNENVQQSENQIHVKIVKSGNEVLEASENKSKDNDDEKKPEEHITVENVKTDTDEIKELNGKKPKAHYDVSHMESHDKDSNGISDNSGNGNKIESFNAMETIIKNLDYIEKKDKTEPKEQPDSQVNQVKPDYSSSGKHDPKGTLKIEGNTKLITETMKMQYKIGEDLPEKLDNSIQDKLEVSNAIGDKNLEFNANGTIHHGGFDIKENKNKSELELNGKSNEEKLKTDPDKSDAIGDKNLEFNANETTHHEAVDIKENKNKSELDLKSKSNDEKPKTDQDKSDAIGSKNKSELDLKGKSNEEEPKTDPDQPDAIGDKNLEFNANETIHHGGVDIKEDKNKSELDLKGKSNEEEPKTDPNKPDEMGDKNLEFNANETIHHGGINIKEDKNKSDLDLKGTSNEEKPKRDPDKLDAICDKNLEYNANETINHGGVDIKENKDKSGIDLKVKSNEGERKTNREKSKNGIDKGCLQISDDNEKLKLGEKKPNECLDMNTSKNHDKAESEFNSKIEKYVAETNLERSDVAIFREDQTDDNKAKVDLDTYKTNEYLEDCTEKNLENMVQESTSNVHREKLKSDQIKTEDQIIDSEYNNDFEKSDYVKPIAVDKKTNKSQNETDSISNRGKTDTSRNELENYNETKDHKDQIKRQSHQVVELDAKNTKENVGADLKKNEIIDSQKAESDGIVSETHMEVDTVEHRSIIAGQELNDKKLEEKSDSENIYKFDDVKSQNKEDIKAKEKLETYQRESDKEIVLKNSKVDQEVNVEPKELHSKKINKETDGNQNINLDFFFENVQIKTPKNRDNAVEESKEKYDNGGSLQIKSNEKKVLEDEKTEGKLTINDVNQDEAGQQSSKQCSKKEDEHQKDNTIREQQNVKDFSKDNSTENQKDTSAKTLDLAKSQSENIFETEKDNSRKEIENVANIINVNSRGLINAENFKKDDIDEADNPSCNKKTNEGQIKCEKIISPKSTDHKKRIDCENVFQEKFVTKQNGVLNEHSKLDGSNPKLHSKESSQETTGNKSNKNDVTADKMVEKNTSEHKELKEDIQSKDNNLKEDKEIIGNKNGEHVIDLPNPLPNNDSIGMNKKEELLPSEKFVNGLLKKSCESEVSSEHMLISDTDEHKRDELTTEKGNDEQEIANDVKTLNKNTYVKIFSDFAQNNEAMKQHTNDFINHEQRNVFCSTCKTVSLHDVLQDVKSPNLRNSPEASPNLSDIETLELNRNDSSTTAENVLKDMQTNRNDTLETIKPTEMLGSTEITTQIINDFLFKERHNVFCATCKTVPLHGSIPNKTLEKEISDGLMKSLNKEKEDELKVEKNLKDKNLLQKKIDQSQHGNGVLKHNNEKSKSRPLSYHKTKSLSQRHLISSLQNGVKEKKVVKRSKSVDLTAQKSVLPLSRNSTSGGNRTISSKNRTQSIITSPKEEKTFTALNRPAVNHKDKLRNNAEEKIMASSDTELCPDMPNRELGGRDKILHTKGDNNLQDSELVKHSKDKEFDQSIISAEGRCSPNKSKNVIVRSKRSLSLDKIEKPQEIYDDENGNQRSTSIDNNIKSSFDISKLQEELKDFEKETNLYSFKQNYNLYLSNKEIKNSSDDGSFINDKNIKNAEGSTTDIQMKKDENGPLSDERNSSNVFGIEIKTEKKSSVDELEDVKSKKEQSAIKIQALWKGYKIRKNIFDVKKKLKVLDESPQKENKREITNADIMTAALIIQASVRGFLQRKKYKKERDQPKMESIVEENMSNPEEGKDLIGANPRGKYNSDHVHCPCVHDENLRGEENKDINKGSEIALGEKEKNVSPPEKETQESKKSEIEVEESNVDKKTTECLDTISKNSVEIIVGLNGLDKPEVPSEDQNKTVFEKPDFYRNNTVEEPEVIKKLYPPTTEQGDDNNNNNQNKELTLLEHQVKDMVQKISNREEETLLEKQVREAVKDIMTNNVIVSNPQNLTRIGNTDLISNTSRTLSIVKGLDGPTSISHKESNQIKTNNSIDEGIASDSLNDIDQKSLTDDKKETSLNKDQIPKLELAKNSENGKENSSIKLESQSSEQIEKRDDYDEKETSLNVGQNPKLELSNDSDNRKGTSSVKLESQSSEQIENKNGYNEKETSLNVGQIRKLELSNDSDNGKGTFSVKLGLQSSDQIEKKDDYDEKETSLTVGQNPKLELSNDSDNGKETSSVKLESQSLGQTEKKDDYNEKEASQNPRLEFSKHSDNGKGTSSVKFESQSLELIERKGDCDQKETSLDVGQIPKLELSNESDNEKGTSGVKLESRSLEQIEKKDDYDEKETNLNVGQNPKLELLNDSDYGKGTSSVKLESHSQQIEKKDDSEEALKKLTFHDSKQNYVHENLEKAKVETTYPHSENRATTFYLEPNQKPRNTNEHTKQTVCDTKATKQSIESISKAFEEHVELIDQVQNQILEQISGSPSVKTGKFDIDLLRKELEEAAMIYKNDDEDFNKDANDELLDYLGYFNPEEESRNGSILTKIKELPSIEEEVELKDVADDKPGDSKEITDYQFCKTLDCFSKNEKKVVDGREIKDLVEVLENDKVKENVQTLDTSESKEPLSETSNASSRGALSPRIGASKVERDNSSSQEEGSKETDKIKGSDSINLTSDEETNFTDTDATSTTSTVTVIENPKERSMPPLSDEVCDKNSKESRDDISSVEEETIQTKDENYLMLQSTQPPAGVKVVTSRRPSCTHASTKAVYSQNGADAQAQQSETNFMESKSAMDGDKRKNNAFGSRTTNSTMLRNPEVEAATKIQAGFRGYQVRKQMRMNQADVSQNAGQNVIQNASQSRQLRGKNSVRNIRGCFCFKGKQKNPEDGEVEEAVIKIQAGVRGYLVRKRQKKNSDVES